MDFDSKRVEQARACQRLWQAVVIQAIQDSKRRGLKPQTVAAKRDAKLWANTSHFVDVCELAGWNGGELNSEIIRDIILHDNLHSALRYIKKEK